MQITLQLASIDQPLIWAIQMERAVASGRRPRFSAEASFGGKALASNGLMPATAARIQCC